LVLQVNSRSTMNSLEEEKWEVIHRATVLIEGINLVCLARLSPLKDWNKVERFGTGIAIMSPVIYGSY